MQIKPREAAMIEGLKEKVVIVTGGGGSIAGHLSAVA